MNNLGLYIVIVSGLVALISVIWLIVWLIYRDCPKCERKIKEGAPSCKHCGSVFNRYEL